MASLNELFRARNRSNLIVFRPSVTVPPKILSVVSNSVRNVDALPSICFWHPVGPHGGETLRQIHDRKLDDVTRYGFTMWSFAPATALRVYAWRAELRRAEIDTCRVLCCGNNTTDPSTNGGEVRWLSEYSEDLLVWRKLPHPRMTSYHRGPTKAGFVASAFYVTAIEKPDTKIKRPQSWFRANGNEWERTSVPTRGEYLVRRPALTKERGTDLRLLLSVTFPYVVWLR